MKNIGAMTTNLLARLPKINFLVLSPGYLSLKGLDPTKEGIGKQLALTYYEVYQRPHTVVAQCKRRWGRCKSVLRSGSWGWPENGHGLKKTFGFVKNLKIAPT
jgi:hypothetical protein